MEVKKLVDNKYEMRLEVRGEDDTLFNVLREKLMSMDNVKDAGYMKEHPMTDRVEFVLFTRNKSAKSILKNAIKELSSSLSSLKRGVR